MNAQETVALVARRMLDLREHFIRDLFDRTLREVRVLDHDERLRALLEASISENIVAGVNYIRRGDGGGDVDAPSAALTYARILAQRDVPQTALIRAYRLGHSLFLDATMAMVPEVSAPSAADGADQAATFTELVRLSNAYIDRVCEQVGRAYELERDRWVSSRSGLRQQWVTELLEGAVVDLEQAQEALGYALGGTHVAVVVWPGDDVPEFEVGRLVDDVGALVAATLGAVGDPLVVPHDERETWAWVPVPPGGAVDPVAVAAAGRGAGRDAFVTVGRPSSGVDGFRRSLRQAEQVRDVRMASGRPEPRVATHEELGVVAFLAQDLDGARRLVLETLGDLAVDSERAEALRTTWRAFLHRRHSFQATAEAVTMHRNSVQYRVQQARDLSATTDDSPESLTALLVALDAAHWLGAAVLSAQG